jgi:prepilin signal peptidase PulO-like enzyme (type II secretory pathway)
MDNQMIPVIFIKLLFSIFSFAIALSDFRTGMVPRIAFVLAFPVFFVLCLLSEDPHPPGVLAVGALFGFFVFLAAYFVSGKKLGLADVWYSALIGLILGPWWWYAAVFCACIAGIIYMLAFKKHKIPFIPLMALGSVVASIFQFFLQ